MKNKEDILAKWLNGEIGDNELEALEGTDAFQKLKEVVQEVDQWSMPKYDTDAGYQKMKAGLQHRIPMSQGSKWVKVVAIASVIGLLLYGLFTYFGGQGEQLEAAPGQHLNYAFQDGSEVWLNDGSSVKYKKSEWSNQRKIELKGEALFEVSKGTPFTVNTPNGTITVLGTQFNVRAWGDNLNVECYEGKVQVQSGDQVTLLTANEGVNIIKCSMNANQVINNKSPLWQEGLSRFYEDKLKVVCAELERQYEISVDLKAADRTFSGNFRHDDLDQALRSICLPLDLSYTISQDKKSVVIE